MKAPRARAGGAGRHSFLPSPHAASARLPHGVGTRRDTTRPAGTHRDRSRSIAGPSLGIDHGAGQGARTCRLLRRPPHPTVSLDPRTLRRTSRIRGKGFARDGCPRLSVAALRAGRAISSAREAPRRGGPHRGHHGGGVGAKGDRHEQQANSHQERHLKYRWNGEWVGSIATSIMPAMHGAASERAAMDGLDRLIRAGEGACPEPVGGWPAQFLPARRRR